MAKRGRRGATPFSLSFLDIMSCGFGAVVLVFLITKHGIEESRAAVTEPLSNALAQLEIDLRTAENAEATLQRQLATLQAEATALAPQQAQAQAQLAKATKDAQRLAAAAAAAQREADVLSAELAALEEEVDSKGRFGDDRTGEAARSVSGDGQRQYLTGLRVGGERILILFDRSASMLDDTIVNVLRLRNMDAATQQAAPKWQRAKGTLEWLTAQLPLTSRFQIYRFSEDWEPALPNTEGEWLRVNSEQLGEAVDAALNELPRGGTDLESVFNAVKGLSPAPDNIILITDGLPTLRPGETPRGTVDGRGREQRFDAAVGALPPAIPLNIILLPLEGDPQAASRYWRLATQRGGSFMSPAEDWP
jgi:hypothetical protein